MTSLEPEIGNSLQASIKMQLARATLPMVQDWLEQALDDWLRECVLSPEGETAAEFSVSLTADLSRLTWWAEEDPNLLLTKMLDYFGELGVSENELDRLNQMTAQLNPNQVGSWIKGTAEAMDVGWYFPGSLPLTQAVAQIPASEATEKLLSWANEYGVETCYCLGRSLASGNTYTQLQLSLPKDHLEKQVYVAVKLFETFELAPPPDEVLGVLLNLGQTGLMVSVWFSVSWVSKVGLLIPQPSTELVLYLCHAIGINQDEALAAFEGMLEVEGATYVECQQGSEGFGVEFHYQMGLSQLS